MESLGIPMDALIKDEYFKNVNVLNTLIVYGISKQSLGNDIRISDIFKRPIDNKKYFLKMSDYLEADFIEVNEDMSFDETLFAKNCFIIPVGMTVNQFYDALRNSIAHKNIAKYKNKYIFFMSFAGKNDKRSVSTAWKNKTKILVLTDCLDDITYYGKFILDYIPNDNI